MIRANLNKIKSEIPDSVTLIAVSKTKPIADILEAYEAGQRDFGENKVQEMTEKNKELPKDIRWHMIGHVQRNKIKYMADFVYLIHGVDNIKTLIEINKQAQKHERIIGCLLQVKIAQEETKFGMNSVELKELLNSDSFRDLKNIEVKGLMGMASFTDNQEQIRREFQSLKGVFDDLRKSVKSSNFIPSILSMGMSGDYKIAIEAGSTMIRVGSAIFGLRNYV